MFFNVYFQRQDDNVKNNQKISSFLKNSSAASSTMTNTIRTLQPTANSIKPGPIFRTILGQGEINSTYNYIFCTELR